MALHSLKRLTLALAGAAMIAGTAARAEEISFIGWSHTEAGLKPTLEKMFADFQAKAASTGDKVQIIGFPFGQMEQNVILRQRTNQRSDVVQLQERWVPQFAAMNALVDLDDVFGKERLNQLYDPEILKLGQVRGKQVGVPFTVGAITMIANRQVLKDAGIAEPPKTMEAFLAGLRQIKARRPNVIPFGFSTKLSPVIQIESMIWFWQHGARFFDDKGKVLIDSPQAHAALKLLAELVADGMIAKGNDRFDTRKLFAKDEVAFFFDPPAVRGFTRAHSGLGAAADDKVIVMPIPVAGNGEPPRAVLWAHHMVMFNQGGARPKRDSLAARFVDAVVFNTDAQLALYREAGQIPSTKAALATLRDDAFVQGFIDASKTALWDETSFWPNGAELRQIIGEEVEAAMLGQKPADQAIRSMARRLDNALKDVR